MQKITKASLDKLLSALFEKQQSHEGSETIDMIPLGASLGIDKETTYEMTELLGKRGYILAATSMGGAASARMKDAGLEYLGSLDEPCDESFFGCGVYSPTYNFAPVENQIAGSHSQVSMVVNKGEFGDDLIKLIESNHLPAEESALLKQAVADLQLIKEGRIPIQPGMFKRFSAVMQKHSWFTGPMLGAILNILIGLAK